MPPTFEAVMAVRDGVMCVYGVDAASGRVAPVSFECLSARRSSDGKYCVTGVAAEIVEGGGGVVEERVEATNNLDVAWALIAPYRRGLVLVREGDGLLGASVRDETTFRRDKVRVAAQWLRIACMWLDAQRHFPVLQDG